MTKKKLSFIWDWENDAFQMTTWKDGLSRAIYLLQEEYDVKLFTLGRKGVVYHEYFDFNVFPTSEETAKAILDWKPDVILCFGDFSRPTIPFLADNGIPMACCLAGGTFMEYADAFDLIFVESASYYDKLTAGGYNVSRAFGTNTEIFKPIKQPKVFDTIFPATFCNWKRHNLFAEAMQGYKAFAFGYMYDDHEVDCWGDCQKNNVMIAPHINAEAISYLYNSAYSTLITSDTTGGSQRTVLESMACGIPPIVMMDSEKTSEYVRESGFGIIVEPESKAIREAVDELKNNPIDPKVGIDYIQSKYSEYCYANSLIEGIRKILC